MPSNFFGSILKRFYEYSNIEIVKINRDMKAPKIIRRILLFLSCPYIFIKGLLFWMAEKVFCKNRMKKEIEADNAKKFKYELGFVAIVKNEGSYICEWISYHYLRCNGKTKFYIYDNESEDNLKEVLSEYIEKGIVEYYFIPGPGIQIKAYEDSIGKGATECRYLAYIDIDEFIQNFEDDVPLQDTVGRIVKANPNACGLALNWTIFGSSGLLERTAGLVMERFVHRAKNDFWANEHVKSIANPRMIKRVASAHYPIYRLGGWNINSGNRRQFLWMNAPTNLDQIRLNHYFGKSRAEYIAKRSRGDKLNGGFYVGFQKFEEYDRNEVFDDSMKKYAEDVKHMIEQFAPKETC